MTTLEILTEAIKAKRTISYEYHKEGEDKGTRIGHSYAVFIFTAKSGQQSTKVHIVQTAGVSKTLDENPFPSFRMYNIQDLANIKLLDEIFSTPYHEKYNPEWDGYKDVIEKV